MMRSQIAGLAPGLMWTRSGVVWAVWRLEALPYGLRPDAAKSEVRAMHTGLLRALRGEALLLGATATVDPASVVAQMLRDGSDMIELEQHPELVAECEATLDFLEGIELGERVFWLATPLRNEGNRSWAEPLRAAFANLEDALAMPRTGPSLREISARQAQAEELRKALPGGQRGFDARPATQAEIVWMHLHAQQRGLGLDLPVPGADANQPESLLLQSPSAIPSPVIDPCGQSDTDGRRPKPLGPNDILKRRYLKITNPDTGAASYQTMLVLADTPDGGVRFPGGEWLGRLDESGVLVDFAQRITIRTREEVTSKNRRANANLEDQLVQRQGENRAGAGSQLSHAAYDLAEYQSLMDNDKLEVEAASTTIFAVAGHTPDQVQDAARDLTSYYASAQFKLVADPTAQEALWWAMLPGVPTTRVVHQYSQITTARHLAAAVPVTSSAVGDSQGSLLGLEISSGLPRAVLIDLKGSGAKLDVAMAVGVVGELGAGKSVVMKKITMDAVDRGATLIAIDRTDMGEWGHAVASIPGSVVVDVSEHAAHSFDPLRIFPPASAGRITQSFLTALLNVSATSDQGIVLNEVLGAAYLERHRITSLGTLTEHLASTDCIIPGSDDVARKIHVFSTKDFGRALFDETLPPVDMDAPALVFWTRLLELPDPDEIRQEHLFAQLKLEKVFGRAVYALVAAIARARCFASSSQLGVFVVDEAHSVTCSPEGAGELRRFVRDGRKHLAALVIGSHDPEADFGDEVMRGLIPFRILMRHRDKTLAQRGLRWLLGLNPGEDVDPALVSLIAEETSPVLNGDGVPFERRGECLVRDFQARVGRVKVLVPAVETRAQAVLTTPTTSSGEKAA